MCWCEFENYSGERGGTGGRGKKKKKWRQQALPHWSEGPRTETIGVYRKVKTQKKMLGKKKRGRAA